MSGSARMNAKGDSLPALVLARALAQPDQAILRRKLLGIWRPTTGAELARAVADGAHGLVALGLRPGETVGILAAPRPEWLIADLAIQSAGGVAAGFHAESAPGELVALMRACATRILFVDTAATLDLALDLRDVCPDLQTLVCFDAAAAADIGEDSVLSLDAVLATGARAQGRSDTPWAQIAGDAQAAILPTSGASAPSKGAVLTHGALRAAVASSLALVDLREGDERLSLMAASHAFERVFGLYACLVAGVVVNFPESAETAFANLRELQPQIVSGPPALWTRIAGFLAQASTDATPLQRNLYQRAMRTRGALADFFVLNKVRRDLGLGRVRLALSGGAPLAADVQATLAALGAPVADVYTLAESAGPIAIASGAPREFALAPGVGVEIGSDGEIRLRAPALFSGYAGAPARPDDWHASGDVGAARSGGFTLHGALEAMAGEGQKRFSTLTVEHALSASPYVSASIVRGVVREDLSALLFIDYENVVRYAQARSTPFTHFKSLADAADIHALFDAEIARINALIAPARIAKFALADRQVAPGDPELGPASNLRRRIALQTFAGRES